MSSDQDPIHHNLSQDNTTTTRPLNGKVWIWLAPVVVVAGTVCFLWLLYYLRSILIPLFLAFVVAYILDPVVDFFQAKGRSRGAGIAIIFATLLILIATILLYAIPQVVVQVQQVTDNIPAFKTFVSERLGKIDPRLAENAEKYLLRLLELIRDHVGTITSSVGTMLAQVGKRTVGLAAFVLDIAVFGVVMIYLLRDFDNIVAWVRDLIPSKHREQVENYARKIDFNLRNFFRGQITVCVILAAIYVIGLTVVQVPFAFFIGLIGGLGNIIPYLGIFLGIVPAVISALAVHHDLLHPVLALVVFAIGQTLEGTLITPKIVGEKVGLSPVAIILAILIFGKLMGFLGILLAVPMIAVLKVFAEEALERYRASALFRDPQ